MRAFCYNSKFTLGVVEVGQVEVGRDYFDWRSTRYSTKMVEVGQHKQTTQICFTLSFK